MTRTERQALVAVLLAMLAAPPGLAGQEGRARTPAFDVPEAGRRAHPGPRWAVDRARSQESDAAVLLRDLEILREKYGVLAEAVPGELYGWRPMAGVRSFSEVFMHAAWVGLRFPSRLGLSSAPVPLEREAAARVTDKAAVLQWLGRGFDHHEAALRSVTADGLATEISFFGRRLRRGEAWSLLLADLHEHLGQLIAYARTNGVVPPWSAEQVGRSRRR